jgi:tetratricopeptide (TPR) repeat protein
MVISIDPHFGAHANLAAVYASQGRFEEAIRESQTGLEYDPDPVYRGGLAWIYAVSGQKEQARATLQELNRLSKQQYIPASVSAAALVALGEKEKAIAALEKGVQERDCDMVFLRGDSTLNSLSSDPLFQRLLRVIGIN